MPKRLDGGELPQPKRRRTTRRASASRDEEGWMSTNDVADHLGVHVDTVRHWANKEGMPHARFGKLLRFKRSEIDAWMRRGDSMRAGWGQ